MVNQRGPFRIEHVPGNRGKTIPDHWEIYIEDSDDSICTVWDSLEMSEMFSDFLAEWASARRAERVQAVR